MLNNDGFMIVFTQFNGNYISQCFPLKFNNTNAALNV